MIYIYANTNARGVHYGKEVLGLPRGKFEVFSPNGRWTDIEGRIFRGEDKFYVIDAMDNRVFGMIRRTISKATTNPEFITDLQPERVNG